jgi:hypothetical protein
MLGSDWISDDQADQGGWDAAFSQGELGAETGEYRLAAVDGRAGVS